MPMKPTPAMPILTIFLSPSILAGCKSRSFHRLFILPGYQFRAIDMLLTNFHLPRSTLFMLVAALAGIERIKAAYMHAVATGYRFFSYGDACLIERRKPEWHR